jgi:hypothetical protein
MPAARGEMTPPRRIVGSRWRWRGDGGCCESHARMCRTRARKRPEDQVTLLGFFCTGLAAAYCSGIPSAQVVVSSGDLPQCPQALGVYRNGHAVGAYVDDTLGGSQAATQACAAQFTTVYAGEAGHDRGVPNGLVEWYPVADHNSRIGTPPSPGEAGYILQAFSWGDNVWDGRGGPFHRCTLQESPTSCAAHYQAPSSQQLRTMWCRALARHPHVILWYYAAGETNAVLRVEHQACTRQQFVRSSAVRTRRAEASRTASRLRHARRPAGSISRFPTAMPYREADPRLCSQGVIDPCAGVRCGRRHACEPRGLRRWSSRMRSRFRLQPSPSEADWRRRGSRRT